jgi:DUF971 family protein
MRPVDVQQIGNELAIRWDDQSESYIPLERLRKRCPCAGCQGERDVMGNLYKGQPRPLTPQSFILKGIVTVGNYALNPVWADGHNAGIYTFEYLRKIAAEET